MIYGTYCIFFSVHCNCKEKSDHYIIPKTLYLYPLHFIEERHTFRFAMTRGSLHCIWWVKVNYFFKTIKMLDKYLTNHQESFSLRRAQRDGISFSSWPCLPLCVLNSVPAYSVFVHFLFSQLLEWNYFSAERLATNFHTLVCIFLIIMTHFHSLSRQKWMFCIFACWLESAVHS